MDAREDSLMFGHRMHVYVYVHVYIERHPSRLCDVFSKSLSRTSGKSSGTKEDLDRAFEILGHIVCPQMNR